MKMIAYLGTVGTIAATEIGQFTAPDLPATPDSPHTREVEDAMADALVASGNFEFVTKKAAKEDTAKTDKAAAKAAAKK
jgi:hypothetical protein